MNYRNHFLEVSIAMVLIVLGVTVMTVPWLGAHALVFVLGVLAAVGIGAALTGRGTKGMSSEQVP